ncbi:hypothetical protein JKF63_03400 [Porcisia hertigi]|uniref:Dual specificity protein phosphatase n=1 Tax=Porcisia hertigi TaxID=2761500 RepID=A0A836IDA3_9TRYP|nr:hypothetical protein JKF63_03400 [Porcisia hertigi]
MPPKVAQPLHQLENNLQRLPDGDIDLFFRVLRFISSYPKLSTLKKATQCAGGAAHTLSTTPSVSVGSSTSMHSSSQSSKTGASASVNNRVVTPPVLREPLETFRMMATNLPIDREGLDAARKTVCHLLRDLCDALGDPAIKKELEGVLLMGKSEPLRTANDGGGQRSSAVEGGDLRAPISFAFTDLNRMQEIVPGLWCGSYHPAADRDLMRSHGVTHVCCCIGTQPRFPGDFTYLTLSADDRPDYDMTPHFARTFEFIENALVKNRGGVLVHCGAGISRAPTVVCAYLMRKLCLSSTAAINLVQSRRPCASPNMGFRQQLHSYGMQLGVKEEAPGVRKGLARDNFSRALNALRKQ